MYISVHRVVKQKVGYYSAAEKKKFKLLMKCPDWVDDGTRGCPVPVGVVLAGLRKDLPPTE